MLNALTIDIEDYFQVHVFSNVIKYEDWDNYESRVERNVERILSILKEATQNSKLKFNNSLTYSLISSLTYSLINLLTQ